MGKPFTAPPLGRAMEEALEHGVDFMRLEVQWIPLDMIQPGANDRVDFKKVPELAASIYEHGLLSPIVVRQLGPDFYRIAGGETRYRAFCMLHQRNPADPKWMAIPAFVKEMDDDQESAVMLIENSVRKDLGPVEEARGYQKRIVCQGWTVEKCAQTTGYGVQRVKNRLALLALRDDVLELIQSGNLDPLYGVVMSVLNTDFQAVAIDAFNRNSSPTIGWWRATCSQLLEQQAQSSLFGLFAMNEQIQAVVDTASSEPVKVEDYKPTRTPRDPRNLLAIMVRDCREHAAAWDKRGSYKERNKFSAAADKLEQALKLLEAASVPQKAKVA